MEVIQKIVHYLMPTNWFKKETNDTNLRVMHGINKISILIFIATLFYLITRWVK